MKYLHLILFSSLLVNLAYAMERFGLEKFISVTQLYKTPEEYDDALLREIGTKQEARAKLCAALRNAEQKKRALQKTTQNQ